MVENDSHSFRNVLFSATYKLGLRDTDLARTLDVPRQSVSQWKHGHIPDPENVARIIEHLGSQMSDEERNNLLSAWETDWEKTRTHTVSPQGRKRMSDARIKRLQEDPEFYQRAVIYARRAAHAHKAQSRMSRGA